MERTLTGRWVAARIVVAAVLASGLVGAFVVLAVRPARPALASAAPGSVRVVAGEDVWGDVVRQVGGRRVQVTSLIDRPGADPHLFEADAGGAAAVSEADLVVVNGLGYDDFLTKLVDGSPARGRQVLVVADVLRRRSGANPHLWYDLPRVPQVAAAIEHALARRDPKHRDEYRANRLRFESSLEPALDLLASLRAEKGGAPVAYTERVAGYLLQRAGTVDRTPAGFAGSVEDGNDPSPRDVDQLTSLLRRRQVAVLVANSQTRSAVTDHVVESAHRYGVPVVEAGESLPRGKSFQRWQMDQLRRLADALRARR